MHEDKCKRALCPGGQGDIPVPAVDGVTVAGGVHHCQAQLDPSLLNLNSRGLNLDSSFNFL